MKSLLILGLSGLEMFIVVANISESAEFIFFHLEVSRECPQEPETVRGDKGWFFLRLMVATNGLPSRFCFSHVPGSSKISTEI